MPPSWGRSQKCWPPTMGYNCSTSPRCGPCRGILSSPSKPPIQEMGWDIAVESRTGDTSSSRKAKQLKRCRTCSSPRRSPVGDAVLQRQGQTVSHLRCVVLDEWHELMSSKRGTQTELCLARLAAVDTGPPHLGFISHPGQFGRSGPNRRWAGDNPGDHSRQPEAKHRDPEHSPQVRGYLSPGPGTWGCGCLRRWWRPWTLRNPP
jgi:hypothetical protein